MSDLRILRDRQASSQEALDSARGTAPVFGSAAILAQTTTVTTYPAAAASFFAMIAQDIDGFETEGAAASYAAESSAVFYAWNAGGAVPPQGTTVVCHAVGGRFVFRYDG